MSFYWSHHIWSGPSNLSIGPRAQMNQVLFNSKCLLFIAFQRIFQNNESDYNQVNLYEILKIIGDAI
jgi:hypothetical protein